MNFGRPARGAKLQSEPGTPGVIRPVIYRVIYPVIYPVIRGVIRDVIQGVIQGVIQAVIRRDSWSVIFRRDSPRFEPRNSAQFSPPISITTTQNRFYRDKCVLYTYYP